MATVIINKEAFKEAFSVLKLPFRKKYIFYTSVVFFVLLAFIYLSTSHTKYIVSSEISLNYPDQSAELVAEDFKSKILVQKAVSQLPFEVNYYKESSPEKEIYKDSLPVKLILNKFEEITYTNNLTIKSLSSHSFSIEHQDTIQFYEINEPVNRYYGKFRVLRGPAFTPHFETVIVKLNAPLDLIEDYYNNLVVSPDESSKTISLSVLVDNSQKGQDFLYKLVELYNSGHSTSSSIKRTEYSDSIKSLTRKLLLLQAGTKKSTILAGPKLSDQQLNTLKVIKPYLEKPVNQFVQVPYTEEVQHQDLRDDLDAFNKMQLEKQRLLGHTKVDDLEVSNIDKRISVLKASVLNTIDRLQKNEAESATQPNKSAERNLQAEILKYQLAQNAEIMNTGNIKIIEKPENNIKEIAPNAFLIYVMAILLGLLSPKLFTLINNLKNTSITQRQWFNSQTFGEKIKILVGVRQID
jgi:hypothetical protein